MMNDIDYRCYCDGEDDDKGERMYICKDRKIPILKRNGKKYKFRMNYRRNSKNKICLDDIGEYGKDWSMSLAVKKDNRYTSSNLGANGWVGIYERVNDASNYPLCECDEPKECYIRKSNTKKNPNKSFYTCRNGNCRFFKWV